MPNELESTARHISLSALEASDGDETLPHGACLVVIHGHSIGRRIELGPKGLSIGRSSRCDLQLDEDSVSRQHARIDFDAATALFRIADLGSTNGTYVNDVANPVVVLRHGDQLQIGRSILKFLAGGHVESAYHEEIYRMMATDGLTQLPNRRAFEETLTREVGRAVHHTRPVAVCMLDLDRFKQINDTYGHLAGDAVLRQIGTLLRANLRRDDTAGRLGGEEFGILLPEVDVRGAMVVAEKVRGIVERHRFEFDHTRIPLTVSIGLTTRTPDDVDAFEVLKRADGLLYQAKRTGRNRVCCG